MKKSGLQNRFPDEVRQQWNGWNECLVCGLNKPEVLHHIMSPSSPYYVAGKHNESILNSCPIHNYTHPDSWALKAKGMVGQGVTQSCHIGNEAWLHDGKNASKLLRKVFDILVHEMQYKLKPIDEEFMLTYSKVYAMV